MQVKKDNENRKNREAEKKVVTNFQPGYLLTNGS